MLKFKQIFNKNMNTQ